MTSHRSYSAWVSLSLITILSGQVSGAYTQRFTKIFEATNRSPTITMVSINDSGLIGFGALEFPGYGDVAFFVTDGGPLTLQADDDADFRIPFSWFSMNEGGSVALYVRDSDHGIMVANAGELTPTVDLTHFTGLDVDGFPSINSKDQVAFWGQHKTLGVGVFVDSNGTIDHVSGGDHTFSGVSGPMINENGEVIFNGQLSTGELGVFIGSEDGVHQVAITEPISIGGNIQSPSMYSPSLSDSGRTAFVVSYGSSSPKYIYLGDRNSAQPVVSTEGPFRWFSRTAVNNRGDFLFRARLDDGRFGIFTGPDPVHDKVIAIGDPLDGSMVSINLAISRESLNNRGQIVFSATLADGREVIYRVDRALDGDLDGNGTLDAFDVDDFEVALADADMFADLRPDVFADLAGDFDNNGVLDTSDISGFEAALAGIGSTVPEPNVLSLLTFGLVGVVFRLHRAMAEASR